MLIQSDTRSKWEKELFKFSLRCEGKYNGITKLIVERKYVASEQRIPGKKKNSLLPELFYKKINVIF